MPRFRACAFRTSLTALSCVLLSGAAFAGAPLPGWGKTHHAGAWEKPFQASGPAKSGTWTALTNPFPGPVNSVNGPETSLLMMDGSVITHDACTTRWYRLTPDSKGSYSNGTWSKIAAMPSGYGPLYFASQILPNGNLIMNGGEYNISNKCNGGTWTNLGAWYDAKKDKWVSVSPPNGWSRIGDAQSVLLPSNKYMLADCCNTSEALGTISKKGAVTWTTTGTGKADDDDEEGWTLIQSTGKVFTVDVWLSPGNPSPAELYDPSSGKWSATTTAPVTLADPSSFELGPAVLLPDNTIFQVGTNPCAGPSCPSHSATYDVASAKWTTGPDEPKLGSTYYTTEDAPAVVLPDGNVLVQMSPSYDCIGGAFCSPSHFFEYDGTSWTQVNDPVSGQAASDASYEGRFLPLPSGQILWISDQGDMEVYTPSGSANPAWLPTVTNVPATMSNGKSYALTGTQLTGVADGAKYGDDAQMAENYPIIRITNTATGDVCTATTKKFSATAAKFAFKGCETGASTLQVVVNAIASTGSAVTVQ